MSGLQRPNLGTRQPPHPRRGFHHQKLPTRLKKVTGFAHRAHPQPQVSALTAPKLATCSIWLWSQSGQNVSEAHTVTFLKLLLSMRWAPASGRTCPRHGRMAASRTSPAPDFTRALECLWSASPDFKTAAPKIESLWLSLPRSGGDPRKPQPDIFHPKNITSIPDLIFLG